MARRPLGTRTAQAETASAVQGPRTNDPSHKPKKGHRQNEKVRVIIQNRSHQARQPPHRRQSLADCMREWPGSTACNSLPGAQGHGGSAVSRPHRRGGTGSGANCLRLGAKQHAGMPRGASMQSCCTRKSANCHSEYSYSRAPFQIRARPAHARLKQSHTAAWPLCKRCTFFYKAGHAAHAPALQKEAGWAAQRTAKLWVSLLYRGRRKVYNGKRYKPTLIERAGRFFRGVHLQYDGAREGQREQRGRHHASPCAAANRRRRPPSTAAQDASSRRRGPIRRLRSDQIR